MNNNHSELRRKSPSTLLCYQVSHTQFNTSNTFTHNSSKYKHEVITNKVIKKLNSLEPETIIPCSLNIKSHKPSQNQNTHAVKKKQVQQTSSFPSSRAASLKTLLLPEWLPQNTHTLLKLVPVYPSSSIQQSLYKPINI